MTAVTSHLLLVRHTAVGVPDGTCYGHLDVPLHDEADQHIAEVLRRLPWPARDADRIVSSPSQRCIHLAEALGESFQVDARLTECAFGDWEGRAWNELPRAELDPWFADFVNVQIGRAHV